MNRLFTAACISLIVMVLGAGVRPAFAQAVLAVIPSQITPPSLRPEPPIVRGGVSIPQSAGAEAPAGSEKFFIVPGGLIVEGEFTELVEIRERLAGDYAGKKVSVAEIFALAARMEQAYVRADTYWFASASLRRRSSMAIP
ncbi:MAG: putative hemolysin activator-like protein with signal peptide [Hyphomicrobiales bacterium]|nr:putative hemolysin activator-like protein with signal peptide [Hyphomicrobiales bacterium]